MAYKHILVDNPTCMRRFHITFDDEAAANEHVELKCPYCDVVVFAAQNHPAATLARDENLTRTTELSDLLVTDCEFVDTFSDNPKPLYKSPNP